MTLHFSSIPLYKSSQVESSLFIVRCTILALFNETPHPTTPCYIITVHAPNKSTILQYSFTLVYIPRHYNTQYTTHTQSKHLMTIHPTSHHFSKETLTLIHNPDTGPGISLDDQCKLFQEYVQLNPSLLQGGGGSGLGLNRTLHSLSVHLPVINFFIAILFSHFLARIISHFYHRILFFPSSFYFDHLVLTSV